MKQRITERIGQWNNVVTNVGAKFKSNIEWKTQIKEKGFEGSQS